MGRCGDGNEDLHGLLVLHARDGCQRVVRAERTLDRINKSASWLRLLPTLDAQCRDDENAATATLRQLRHLDGETPMAVR